MVTGKLCPAVQCNRTSILCYVHVTKLQSEPETCPKASDGKLRGMLGPFKRPAGHAKSLKDTSGKQKTNYFQYKAKKN